VSSSQSKRGTDPEHSTSAGQNVECRHDLRGHARVPVRRTGDDRDEPRTRCVRGKITERRIRLEHAKLGGAERWDLEEVVHHADEVETALVPGARDLHQGGTDLFGAAGPAE